MAKKVILNESMFNRLMCEQVISESEVTKAEISKMIKDAIKDDRTINKDIEKKVKALVAQAVNTLFRTLWQRRNFYEDEIKR
jgi:BMFP domain-containing protein YqiC